MEFGLQIGLWDVTGSVPSVKYVHIIEHGLEAPTAVDLQSAVPLTSLAPSVGEYKSAFATAIDLLHTEHLSDSELDQPESVTDSLPAQRGYGPAVQVTLFPLPTVLR